MKRIKYRKIFLEKYKKLLRLKVSFPEVEEKFIFEKEILNLGLESSIPRNIKKKFWNSFFGFGLESAPGSPTVFLTAVFILQSFIKYLRQTLVYM